MSQEMPQPSPEPEEKQLCVSCMAPNEPSAHFCAKCGAPLTSYASTGPFESLFSEGAVYRQAAERPRSFIVVLGIWLIFGAIASAGVVMIAIGRDSGLGFTVVGVLTLVISLVMIGKTTKNFFAKKQRDEKRDA